MVCILHQLREAELIDESISIPHGVSAGSSIHCVDYALR